MLLVAFAAIWCVACSDDDGDSTNQKQVKSITCKEYDYNDTWVDVFEYDNQGRITSIKTTTEKDGMSTIKYTYEKNKIIATQLGGKDALKMEYTLNDKGLVVSSIGTYSDGETENECTYSYNADNQLIKIDGDNESEYTWKNGNLITETRYGDTQTYSYSKYANKTIGVNFFDHTNFDPDYLNGMGFMGKRNANLLDYWIRTSPKTTFSYEYTFDDDGYVTTMKEYYQHDGEKKKLGTLFTIEYN